MFLKAVPLGGS